MDLVTPISKNTGISSLAFIPALEGDAFQIFLPQSIRAIAAIANEPKVRQNLIDLAQDLETDQDVVVGLHAATSGNNSCQKVLDTLARQPVSGYADVRDPADTHLAELGDAIRSFVQTCSGAFEPQGYQLALIALTLKVDFIRIAASEGSDRWPGGNEASFLPLSSKDEAFYCVHNTLAATLMELNLQPVSAYEHAMRLIMHAAPEFVPDLTASQVAEDRAA